MLEMFWSMWSLVPSMSIFNRLMEVMFCFIIIVESVVVGVCRCM